MDDALLQPTFLFRFKAPCLYKRSLWAAAKPALDASYQLPSFGELEGRPLFADVRAAWNKAGLMFIVRARGKRQSPWCRATRLDESDGLHLWIDTRDTRNIHRASRFCHRFVFTPAGGGRHSSEPVAELIPIHRAREQPQPIAENLLRIRSERRVDGYVLQGLVPAAALTGFDPSEHPRLGFTYAVVDRELGWQTFSVGPEFPISDDPTLWGTLELVRRRAR